MFFKENELEKAMENEIMPFLSERLTASLVEGYDKNPLYVCHYRAIKPRGTVLILHGLAETAEKYREMIYYFLKSGLDVLVFDQRGHGRSYRVAAQGVTHIDRFEEYVLDAECVLNSAKERKEPLYLFAHSMGGGVGALWLEKHPTVFKKAVLSSPLIAPYQSPFVRLASRALCLACKLLGKGHKKVFVSKKSEENERFETSSSTSLARYSLYRALRREQPILGVGAPSYGWSYVALDVKRHILKKGAPERVKTPVLILSAKQDHLVLPLPQQEFARRVACGEWRELDCKHELYFSPDDVFYAYMAQILEFFGE